MAKNTMRSTSVDRVRPSKDRQELYTMVAVKEVLVATMSIRIGQYDNGEGYTP